MSYASVQDLKKVMQERGITPPAENECEQLLTKAMDYLFFLRLKNIPDPVPSSVVLAQCLLAIEAQKGELLPSIREPQIKSERVEGAVSAVYAVSDGNVFIPRYPIIEALLREYTGKDITIKVVRA